VLRLRSLARNPFSFLFTRSTSDDRIAAYVLREHDRGRSLAEILDDPYVRNRTTPQERARLLERPEIVEALGHEAIARVRAETAST
jgi:hypothetical protein